MIALVDCNNFFASCERLFRPDLIGRPVLVLSNNDGCVVARSEEVKALHVPMGVPYFKVRDIVAKNNVTCFSSNFALYSDISQRVLAVLADHAPHLEVYSIDEAFLDISQSVTGNLLSWGQMLEAEIFRLIGVPVSVGIAPTKTLAKLASAYAKQHRKACLIDPFTDNSFYKTVLAATPVGRVWGVGWRMAPKLEKAGIKTALQLAGVSQAWLQAKMGVGGVKLLHELRGRAAHPFTAQQEPQKTLMASRSFGHTVKSMHDLESAVATFASQAAYRLRSHEQKARSFGLYLRSRSKEGTVQSHSLTAQLAVASSDTRELVKTALALLKELYDDDLGYKKAGVFADHLQSAHTTQLNLLEGAAPADIDRKSTFMRAVDSINQRFGSGAMHIGSIDPKTTRWHMQKNKMSPAYTTDWEQLPLVYAAK